jgi:CRISPR-associated protein Cas1
MFDNVLWNGRQPRIKANYVNALLDLGYSMLFNMADSMLQIYGFDTYCGVYHREFYMRKSLACDVMEPMRPIIDYIVRKGINLKQFKKDDFEVINQRYVLRYRECSKYVNVFMSGILQYKDEMFLFIQSYYRSFMKSKN